MRKGMNSLCGVVQNLMGYDVRMGDVFIFINRNRTTMKLLHAEDGGLVLFETEEQIGCLESVPGSVHFLPAIRMVGFTSP